MKPFKGGINTCLSLYWFIVQSLNLKCKMYYFKVKRVLLLFCCNGKGTPFLQCIAEEKIYCYKLTIFRVCCVCVCVCTLYVYVKCMYLFRNNFYYVIQLQAFMVRFSFLMIFYYYGFFCVLSHLSFVCLVSEQK